jgi:LacI family transcriptional regulator
MASVSRALNGTGVVTESIRTRVLEAAARLQYVPNSGAQSLMTRRTHTIGIVLPTLYGEFFSELIRGIDIAARARGLHLLISSTHCDAVEARCIRSSAESTACSSCRHTWTAASCRSACAARCRSC